MLESFDKTKSPDTDVAIYIDDNDPRLEEYIAIKRDKFWIMPRQDVAQLHNWMADTYAGYDYYMPINDDIIFETQGWDKILMDAIENKGGGWGISYPDDSTENWKHNLPTFGMISGNIVRTIGHVYPRTFRISFGDNFLLDLGRALGRLFYCDKAIIRHFPPGVALSAFVPDDLRLNPNMHKEESLNYARYIDNEFDGELKRIFEAIINEQSLVGANR